MKTYLITGSSGAIGARLVPLLLEEKDIQVRLLLRASSQGHLDARLNDLGAFWEIPIPHGRIKAFKGDVTLPHLGMSEADYAGLVSECTHVIHSAGNVRMNLPLEAARSSAVNAAKNITAFAGDCRKRGNLEKLEFISTVGIAGEMAGTIPETWIDEERKFHNTYEEAKAEAEVYIRAQVERGLPVTVHRPSMVVGDSKTGKIVHFQVFYHLCEFLSGRKTLGFLPKFGDACLDIIPVDYVACAIAWSSKQKDAIGRIFHLCSGPNRSISLNKLKQTIDPLFKSRGQRLPYARFLPLGVFQSFLPFIGLLGSKEHKKALNSLPYFLEYLKGKQYFDNAGSRSVLESKGIFIPQVQAYIGKIFNYYFTQKKSRRS